MLARPEDIREIVFASIRQQQFCAEITTERDGVISGVGRLHSALSAMGIESEICVDDGAMVCTGRVVARIRGTPSQIAIAEEFSIGALAKPSGIATRARRAVELAGSEMRIVCGAWKKMPSEIKTIVRDAIVHGNAAVRITDLPFLYLDKNFVRMFGGIRATLEAVAEIDKLKVIQLKGEFSNIAMEAVSAVKYGAGIVMVDTGSLADAELVHSALLSAGCRNEAKLAFAKGIRLKDIADLKGKGIDILDIGAVIVDAPLLDMRLDVRNGLNGN